MCGPALKPPEQLGNEKEARMTSDQAIFSNSFNATSDAIILSCVDIQRSLDLTLVYAFLHILLVPLYILVLLVGFQQWQQQQQQQGALSPMTTSDIFTYMLVLIEIVVFFSAVVFAAGSWLKSMSLLVVSFCLFMMNLFGEALFQCGICLDKYLAIVHPITYRKFKESRAVLVRNVAIVVCWIIIFTWIKHVLNIFPEFPAKELLASVVAFTAIVLYCCFASLYVLTRPGPNGRKHVDKTKLKAFHIISIITGLLLLKITGTVGYLCIYILVTLNPQQTCLMLLSSVIIIVPVNALVPLLYLRRKKRPCC